MNDIHIDTLFWFKNEETVHVQRRQRADCETSGLPSTGSRLHELPCVAAHVYPSVCLTDCVILCDAAGVNSRHVRGVRLVRIHLFRRDGRGGVTHQDKRRQRARRSCSAFRLSSRHNPAPGGGRGRERGAETPGIDSQAAGQRDRQTGMCTQEAHAHLHAYKQQRQQLSVILAVQLRMIHTLHGCGVFCFVFFPPSLL